MTEIADRYARAANSFADTIDAVRADAWSNPSPCEEWSALDLVQHVVDAHGIFEGLVGRELGEVPPVPDDPAAAFAAARAVVEGNLRDPGAAAVEFDGFQARTTFAEAVDRFITFDLVIHRWDLARATGQDETIPADEVQACFEQARSFGDAIRGPGAMGPEIAVGDDADDQTRLLAYLGRRA